MILNEKHKTILLYLYNNKHPNRIDYDMDLIGLVNVKLVEPMDKENKQWSKFKLTKVGTEKVTKLVNDL